MTILNSMNRSSIQRRIFIKRKYINLKLVFVLCVYCRGGHGKKQEVIRRGAERKELLPVVGIEQMGTNTYDHGGGRSTTTHLTITNTN